MLADDRRGPTAGAHERQRTLEFLHLSPSSKGDAVFFAAGGPEFTTAPPWSPFSRGTKLRSLAVSARCAAFQAHHFSEDKNCLPEAGSYDPD